MTKRKKSPRKSHKIRQLHSDEENSYFVSAKNPIELRRHILESSKKTVLSMQNFQRLQMIREQKMQELANIRQSIKELTYLNKKLNEKLPHYDTSLLHEFKHITKESQDMLKSAAAEPEEKKEERVEREKSDMEKLEESLSSIEKKLKSIQ